MSRYDRSYDYGLRGYPQTMRPRARPRGRRPRYDQFFEAPYAGTRGEIPMPNRVTQRYNRDYVDDRLNEQRAYGWGGDRLDRTVDGSFYRPPYSTIGGTRTFRGSPSPQRSTRGRFGPTYGGRFPDEL